MLNMDGSLSPLYNSIGMDLTTEDSRAHISHVAYLGQGEELE